MNENTKRKKSEKNMNENIKANLCCWNNGREKNEEIKQYLYSFPNTTL